MHDGIRDHVSLAPTTPSKLLVVDDEAGITDALKAGLEHHGFEVDAYNDPAVALASIGGRKYDLAIFDVRMPKMDGFELFRRFRKIDGQAKVCFLTAFEVYQSEFEKLFPDVQVKGLFRKPISTEQLQSGLDEIIGRQEDGRLVASARTATGAV